MYIIVKNKDIGYNGREKGLANMMFRNKFAGGKSLTHNYLFRQLYHLLMRKMHGNLIYCTYMFWIFDANFNHDRRKHT